MDLHAFAKLDKERNAWGISLTIIRREVFCLKSTINMISLSNYLSFIKVFIKVQINNNVIKKTKYV